MKKGGFFIILIFAMAVSHTYGQHRVNDIREYGGWYKINYEMDINGSLHYAISQYYPNGDEYKISSDERKQLPLYMKIFCIALSEELLGPQMLGMTVKQDGYFMQVTGFSFIINFSQSDEEILESLGLEMIIKYQDRDW
ncbi:hypothetical protein AGMMS49579_10180 [Spirochaetia bacterium]|nr:hypothetical protein AGMMS49579_10180 [Spirochaetia bacterium]